jgi:cytidine deaminase
MLEMVDLSDQDIELIGRAIETADRLYLEGVHEVAAALRTQGGLVFSGIHIEANVGFADVCGEVAAICTALSNGHRDLETIVAVYQDAQGQHEIMAPCGRCRELITDFSPDCWVIVGSCAQPYKVRAHELLPLKC